VSLPIFEAELRSYLLTLSPITDLVARRIYGMLREPNSELPALIIQRTHTLRQRTFCGPGHTIKLVSADFQLDSYALTGQDAWQLASALRDALIDFQGMMGATFVNAITLSNEFPLVDPEPGDIRVTQLFNFWYVEG
jgi:hypothetical protein